MLMMLLKQNAYIDAEDINGMSPLHVAVMKKDSLAMNLKIIERLINFGANIN